MRDPDRLKLACKKVNVLVHAAAMKHVEASEYNPMECIKTNIIGAQNIVEASIAAKVERVIALSTDKAVNPTNLYGASKLASDKIFVAANNLTGDGNTTFSIVRYGNVFGSRGSVIPLFLKLRLDEKNTLPITNFAMTVLDYH